MKKTWNTPECKELTWDKTMNGQQEGENETFQGNCAPDDLGDQNLLPNFYPYACNLSS